MSSSGPATAKWTGCTSGAWAGSRLLTASIPKRSTDASQSCHSATSSAASQGWMSMSVSFTAGRSARANQAVGDPDVGSKAGQVGGQVLGGGVERLVGQRFQRIEDEQRRGGVFA